MELMTSKDVAKILKVSESMAYQLMRTEIPCVRLGRSIRVRPEDLEQYLKDKVDGHEDLFSIISDYKYP
jgi:excisionase family DNA binding protein